MIGWTIFNCLCLGACLIFMFGCDKSYLSKLLKYDTAMAAYIFSFINAWRAILPWEHFNDTSIFLNFFGNFFVRLLFVFLLLLIVFLLA